MATRKKGFTTSTDAFITKPAETKEEPKATEKKPKAMPEPDLSQYEVPNGYKLVKVSRTRRLQLLITQQTGEGLETAARLEGISINELCNRIFDLYLEGNL